MKIREIKVFTFDELPDTTKEKARDWFRQGFDYDWWDSIYEDAVECGKCLGIEIGYKSGRNMKGEPTRGVASIYFSGFSSQGDGACFEGNYSYRKGWLKVLKNHAPNDTELCEIGKALQEAQRMVKWSATATIQHSGRYYHERSIDVRCDCEGGIDASDGWENTISECMTDFCLWIYKQLRTEWDYLNSDEAVDESIMANEYEFTEDGTIA